MQRYPEATPCPTSTTSASLEASSFQLCDPTEQINFTIDDQTASRKAAFQSRISIWPQIRSESLVAQSTEAFSDGAASPNHLSDHEKSNTQTNTHDSTDAGKASQVFLPPGRRVSILRSERHLNISTTVPNQGKGISQQGEKHIRKKRPRRSMWVPLDDTTILTIHPSDAGKKSQGRPLAAAPKRAPLQPTLKSLQESEDQHDTTGNGPGKENLPPLTANKIKKVSQSRARRVSLFGGSSRYAADHLDFLPSSNPFHVSREQSTSAAKVGSSNYGHKNGVQTFGNSVKVKQEWNPIMNRRNTLCSGTTWKASVDPHISNSASQLSSTLIVPVLRKVALSTKQKYPILHEDVERPEMFEGAWLNDREASLAQCVNDLFENTDSSKFGGDLSRGHLTRTLLTLYQGAECSLLHNRLKASLLYGSLRPPKDFPNPSSMKSDIGIRRKFITLWAGEYNLDTLRVVAEVIVGREALVDSQFSKSKDQYDDAYNQNLCKKNLEAFLESYLLRNEDASEAERSCQAWSWRRTISRSLMLIYLLDKAKQMNTISTNLYQASSTIKSSLAFLKKLTALMHPSVGNIYRLLKHLDYHVHHIQYPLSEFSYKVENLATDLRDGVRLTRLVELLLYPPGSRTKLKDVLTTTLEQGQSWVLSQHLKYPCTARTQRIYNVQLALNALRAVGEVGQIAEDVRAEEIVDGHREKTVTFLWALLGNLGLENLVNFDELREELRRLRKADNKMSEDEPDVGDCNGTREGFQNFVHLLRAWSESIARRNSLRVLNLTTSFADGEIFARIIDEYLPYLSGVVPINFSGDECQLDARLRAIGCSTSFTSIFGRHERCRIFDRDFTIASLAFLAFRLIGASKRGRAAAVIQRAYRRTRNRKVLERRCRLLKLAHDCKVVLETRNRDLKAARVLQKAWRAHVEWMGEHRIASTRPRPWTRGEDQTETVEDNADIWLMSET